MKLFCKQKIKTLIGVLYFV